MPPKYFRKKSTKSSSDFPKSRPDAIYLVIVESPSKCAKIEGFLGNDYKCIASKGHIRYIDGIKNIAISKDFAIKFSLVDEKKDHVSFMKSCISDFRPENIILATDDDREGEAIAWHICDQFGLSTQTTKRIVFHEITKPAILKAIQKPSVIDMNMVMAQHARQVLDMVVGFKVSPFLWKHIHNNKTNGLSAGRCQTPALRLVHDNDKLVCGGEPETKYKTTGTFFAKGVAFSLNHDFVSAEEVEAFLEESANFDHQLSVESPKDSTRQPPKPYNTSNLLQSASNVLHMSPKETMNHCQALYQAGYITYMRTENTKYSADFLPKVRSYVIEKWGSEQYVGDFSAIVNNDETNPHEAIRVTHIETEFVSGLEARAQTLYRLIWKNSVESCMAAAHYKCTRALISAPLEYAYTHVVEVPVFLGWKIVSAQSDCDVTDDQNTGAGLLMYFKTIRTGSPIPYVKIESVVVVSHRHSHYTESSLIKKLEDLGIGRPSTFSMIVDTILERGYVKKTDIAGITKECNEFVLRGDEIECRTVSRVFGAEKNKLVIQPIGIAVAEFLTEHFTSLFDYDYTKTMEDDLDKIASTNLKWNELCEKCDETIKVLAKPLAKMEKPKYIVKSRNGTQEYEFVFHQYGASLKYQCGEETLYKAVNPKLKIDIEDVKAGKYMAEDLLEIKDDYLGKYQDADMYIKNGKFGHYVQWGDQTASIKGIQKPLGEIVMADVVKCLEKGVDDDLAPDNGNKPRAPPKNINILRNLNADLSIRKGKYGPYIYYMPQGAKTPQFFKLTKFKTTWATSVIEDMVQWICETYVKK